MSGYLWLRICTSWVEFAFMCSLLFPKYTVVSLDKATQLVAVLPWMTSQARLQLSIKMLFPKKWSKSNKAVRDSMRLVWGSGILNHSVCYPKINVSTRTRRSGRFRNRETSTSQASSRFLSTSSWISLDCCRRTKCAWAPKPSFEDVVRLVQRLCSLCTKRTMNTSLRQTTCTIRVQSFRSTWDSQLLQET